MSKSTLIKDLVAKKQPSVVEPAKPEDEMVVDEVLSEIKNEGHHQQHPEMRAMSRELEEQIQIQEMLQSQIMQQQELLNLKEAELAQQQQALSTPVPSEKPTGLSVASLLSTITKAVFGVNYSLLTIASILYLLFQYVNITIVLNAILRALRMRECVATTDNGVVVQTARSVVFGTLVSLATSFHHKLKN